MRENVSLKSDNPNLMRTGLRKPIKRICPMTRTVQVYKSIGEAAAFGYDATMIARACHNRRTTYKGCTWEFLDAEGYAKGKPLDQLCLVRRLKATNTNSGLIKFYDSVLDAELDGFERTKIARVCRGQQASHRGWKFEFAQ